VNSPPGHERGATSGVEGRFDNHRLLHTPAEENLSPLGKENKRLGHLGKYKLLQLAKEGELTGWNPDDVMNDPFKITDCVTCQQFKMTRHPKGKHSPRGTRDAELSHVDMSRAPSEPRWQGGEDPGTFVELCRILWMTSQPFLMVSRLYRSSPCNTIYGWDYRLVNRIRPNYDSQSIYLIFL
jgi:hypothetical protein